MLKCGCSEKKDIASVGPKIAGFPELPAGFWEHINSGGSQFICYSCGGWVPFEEIPGGWNGVDSVSAHAIAARLVKLGVLSN